MPNENLKVGQQNIDNWREKLIGPGKTTTGNNLNSECPYCGKNNSSVTKGILVTLHEPTTFERPCAHCDKIIFYKAEFVIRVTAKAPELDKFEKFPPDPVLFQLFNKGKRQ